MTGAQQSVARAGKHGERDAAFRRRRRADQLDDRRQREHERHDAHGSCAEQSASPVARSGALRFHLPVWLREGTITRMLRLLRILLCAAALAPGLLLAQAYPAKPVRLIVPFPAGGPADIFGRYLAQGMSAPLGQTVVVENISGMSGVLGVDRAAKSPPDGYTLALISSSAASIGPFAMAKCPSIRRRISRSSPPWCAFPRCSR